MKAIRMVVEIPLTASITSEEDRVSMALYFLRQAGGIYTALDDQDSVASAGILGSYLVALHAAGLDKEEYAEFKKIMADNLFALIESVRDSFDRNESRAEVIANAEMEAALARMRGSVQ